jgi:hypothetical protein
MPAGLNNKLNKLRYDITRQNKLDEVNEFIKSFKEKKICDTA